MKFVIVFVVFISNKMPNCGAYECRGRATDHHPGKSFHRLPSESRKELRKAWLMKINREHIPKELFICSDHFKPKCFERDLKIRIFLI